LKLKVQSPGVGCPVPKFVPSVAESNGANSDIHDTTAGPARRRVRKARPGTADADNKEGAVVPYGKEELKKELWTLAISTDDSDDAAMVAEWTTARMEEHRMMAERTSATGTIGRRAVATGQKVGGESSGAAENRGSGSPVGVEDLAVGSPIGAEKVGGRSPITAGQAGVGSPVASEKVAGGPAGAGVPKPSGPAGGPSKVPRRRPPKNT
jgi:hypothetical protein